MLFRGNGDGFSGQIDGVRGASSNTNAKTDDMSSKIDVMRERSDVTNAEVDRTTTRTDATRDEIDDTNAKFKSAGARSKGIPARLTVFAKTSGKRRPLGYRFRGTFKALRDAFNSSGTSVKMLRGSI